MTLPEGRQPIEAQDMAKLHPSTWEAECRWQTIRAQQAIDEAKALRARVAKLEAALERIKPYPGYPGNTARAALQQEAEP